MDQSSTWVTWVWVGVFLFVLILAFRVIWHSRIVQALWLVLLYNFGVDAAKIHIHQSRWQKRRQARKDSHDRLVRQRRESKAIAEFLPKISTLEAATGSRQVTLGPNDSASFTVKESGLVEDRSTGGSWIGRSGNLSFPLGHHRHVRYSSGRSYGRYVKAPPSPTVVDVGVTTVTSKGLIFRGASQTRECSFDHLLAYEFFPDGSGISLSVSGKESTLRITYGEELGPWFAIRWRFMMAQRRGEIAEFLNNLNV